jgi:type IV secretory pathway VirB2 component (pilin)
MDRQQERWRESDDRAAADKNAAASEQAYRETIALLLEILTGNISRRVWGVILILAGLAVATVGNVWSLTL